MFSDGFVECVERIDQPRPPGTITLVASERTFITDHEPLDLVSIFPMCQAEDKKMGIVAIGGDTSMGNEGFVAATDLSKQLLWIAFFDFSNPFVSVEFNETEILAKNNHRELWHFPIQHPSRITIETP
jgi:hypothetical protein